MNDWIALHSKIRRQAEEIGRLRKALDEAGIVLCPACGSGKTVIDLIIRKREGSTPYRCFQCGNAWDA